MKNPAFVLTINNQTILGDVRESDDSVIIEKPYNVYMDPSGQVFLTPAFQHMTGQEANMISINPDTVMSIVKAENNNEIYQEYLKIVTGIVTPDSQILYS